VETWGFPLKNKKKNQVLLDVKAIHFELPFSVIGAIKFDYLFCSAELLRHLYNQYGIKKIK
jgi:hypothetical protein